MVTDDEMLTAGVDEAGRGPLAGPVVAAAVIPGEALPAGITDSKKLSARRRARLASQIVANARSCTVAWASVAEIETLNIAQATLVAMQRAVMALPLAPCQVLVDGNRIPAVPYACQSVVKGDASIEAIAAASIVAKESRDKLMRVYDRLYPSYGFARHKGYPTADHRAALAAHGVAPVYRRTFRPVSAILKECL